MKITVLVPTYQRPNDVCRCLDALKEQSRPADQVVLVVRDTDQETWDILAGYQAEALPLDIITVSLPGTVEAMRRGLQVTVGEVVALTDDDAAPRPDWLARIEPYFAADPKIGAVGGRDWLHYHGHIEDGNCTVVGKVQWFGRLVGNHHLGAGPSREVDTLKGVSSAYRTDLLRQIDFDPRMRGIGTVLHWEVGLGLGIKKRGYKLFYDPLIAVDHYLAQRSGTDSRVEFRKVATINAIHNETLCLLDYLPPHRRLIFLIWQALIGTKTAPGLLLMAYLAACRSPHIGSRIGATMQGRALGVKSYLTSSAKQD